MVGMMVVLKDVKLVQSKVELRVELLADKKADWKDV